MHEVAQEDYVEYHSKINGFLVDHTITNSVGFKLKKTLMRRHSINERIDNKTISKT